MLEEQRRRRYRINIVEVKYLFAKYRKGLLYGKTKEKTQEK